MSRKAKVRGRVEQAAGKAIRKAAHARRHDIIAAMGGTLEAVGKARRLKAKGKDSLSPKK
ncbi:hypothetical protein [Streptomyces sp. NPDC002825]|uniref:hypothetical protein n=1 Tax=Streptomyces sp. NPDC002825 TaxID=3154666 RepID=UPI003326BF9A